MNSNASLKMGTRASPLAMAQSRVVAQALERYHPGLDVEIIPMMTDGDRDTNTPLHQVKDAGYFSTQLDRSLLSGEVDFCVHSRKDLSEQRPSGITTAAIPQRENPRDVVIFNSEVLHKLQTGEPLKIGSSSLRRAKNVGAFLQVALPAFGQPAQIQFVDLRGPVDQRLEQIHQELESDNYLDGIVLALAGLSRLYNDAYGHLLVAPLLQNVHWMVLPLGKCPTAPGQGALAIECRTDDARTKKLLQSLHDPVSADLVEREIEIFSRPAEADRAALGVTAVYHRELGDLAWSRGETEINKHEEQASTELMWRFPPVPKYATPCPAHSWKDFSSRVPTDQAQINAPAVFVAHWNVLASTDPWSSETRTWVSGVSSWSRLAQRGIWVEGCADNLGFEFVRDTLTLPVLNLPVLDKWQVLTYEQAVPSWNGMGIPSVTASYRLEYDANKAGAVHQELAAYSHFYWGSPEQYRVAEKWLPHNAQHACGPGKTAATLRDHGVHDLMVFPSREVWQQWLT
jgi:hydroxymethylbilane synthase